MFRAACLFILMCAASSAAAQVSRPPAGQSVDESRHIQLLPRVSAPCIAIVKGEATLLLPGDELRRLADAKPDPAKSEEARLAFIQGRRAASLLALLGSAQDARGCLSIRKELTVEEDYLVVDLLEHGRAQVLVTSTGETVPAITVRYLAQAGAPLGGRGDIMFTLPGVAAPFMVTSWWVS